MKRYQLVISRKFEKDLKKIPKRYRILILKKLKLLKSNPHSGRKIRNAEIGKYRIRIGVYRLRYDIEEKQILILRVLHRKEAYRN
jgi:mRNA interferase RelE/StbE